LCSSNNQADTATSVRYPKKISILFPCVLTCSPDVLPPAFYHVTPALTTYRSSHNDYESRNLVQEYKLVVPQLFFYYVEIKCQLDATDDFYCGSYCLLNMFRTPLCPSSEYYTSGCCLSYLVLWFKPKHQIRQATTTCIIISSS